MSAGRQRWDEAGNSWERLRRWHDTGRAADTDDGAALDALSDISSLRRVLDEAELSAVRAARRRGSSWAEIATMLGVTRQSAWEKWRELDEPGGSAPESGPVERAIGRAARAARRQGTVSVPDVVGMQWENARSVLREHELVATCDDADVLPDQVVVDQSPESGARVAAGTTVRLWLARGGGGSGVREPRRPVPEPRSGRAMRQEVADEAVG